MCRARRDHRFILVSTDEVTNCLVTVPFYRGTSHEIGKNQAFLSSVMQHIYKRLGIKIKIISPYNHGSLKKER